MVSLYIFYRPKKKSSRTDITTYDQKNYKFVPKYVYVSTGYHRHMISVVVFFYSNILKSMLVDYAVTEISCFDDYLDAAPWAKTIRGNGIITFILHFAQCITFHQKHCYSNNYFRGIVEVIISKFRFQGY